MVEEHQQHEGDEAFKSYQSTPFTIIHKFAEADAKLSILRE
jgi:hypothetical protein